MRTPHQHYWSEWTYHHNGGGEHENYWSVCVNPHWPKESCGEIKRVFVNGQLELLKEISETIESTLSGQYGADDAYAIALEILGIFQAHKK